MSAPPLPRREPLARGLVRAALLALAGGALVGALEALDLLARADLRYTRWGARIPLVAAGAYAFLGAGLALPSLLLARVLYGRPAHRAAPPSTCAGLGAIAALAALALTRSLPNPALLPAALAGTLLFLALKELLGWWTAAGRAAVWWALAGAVLALCALLSHRLAHGGSASLVSACAAGLGLLAAGLALVKRGSGRFPLSAAALALPVLALVGQWQAAYPRVRAEGGRQGRANVLHVSIDTLRADQLGCYGNAQARTPTIDGLAAEGILFENTCAQANTTGPSHTTQLTGLYPVEHGALSNGRPLSPQVATLPDLLAGGGAAAWSTAAFVSGFTLVNEACGLAPRFGYYDDNQLAWQWLPQAAERLQVLDRLVFRLAARAGTRVTRSDRPAGWTVDSALDWLARRGEDSAPFYVFLHFYDPHAPYEPPAEYAPDPPRLEEFDWYALGGGAREALVADESERAHMLALYQGEIAYVDAQLKRVLDVLAERGELEDTLVIVTSDHGEGLGSHGYYYDHGTFLYDEELHVPLILRLPGAEHAGTRVAGQTRLLDLAPTILELCKLPAAEPMSGTSLVPLFDGTRAAGRPSFALAEMAGDVSNFSLLGRRLALRTDQHKLIWTSTHWLDTERVPARYELFDLPSDPDEQTDLYDRGLPAAAPLEQQLADWNAALESLARSGTLSADLAEHLRALGYL